MFTEDRRYNYNLLIGFFVNSSTPPTILRLNGQQKGVRNHFQFNVKMLAQEKVDQARLYNKIWCLSVGEWGVWTSKMATKMAGRVTSVLASQHIITCYSYSYSYFS